MSNCVGGWLILMMMAVGGLQAQTTGRIDRRTDITRAVAKTRDAIVNIRTLRVIPARFEGAAESGGRVKGLGTGVVFDPRGYVVTNYHVIQDVDSITVQTAGRHDYEAKVLCHDPKRDLAILRILGADGFANLPLQGPGKAIVGETVIVIGNPYGLEDSVTVGYVSAVDREQKLPNGEYFQGLIQTSALINPGNSGGPLLDINGDLLGINVAIRSNAQGIAFAIPTAQVREIIEKLMDPTRHSPVAKFGLEVEGLVDDVAHVGFAEQQVRPRVKQVVTGSPADRAGIRPGDELRTLAGQPLRTKFDLRRILWDRRSGDSIAVQILRQGRDQVDLILPFPAVEGDDEVFVRRAFGAEVSPVPADRVQAVVRNDEIRGGLLIRTISADSPAERAGLQPGDILFGLHDRQMCSAYDIRWVMSKSDLDLQKPISFHLIRNGTYRQGMLYLSTRR